MAVSTSKPNHPTPSPLSKLIQSTTSSLPIPDSTASLLSVPLEILHNLQHQHAWTSLELHYIHPTKQTLHRISLSSQPSQQNLPSNIPPSTSQFLLSGLPPRHAYIHPDAQMRLLKEGRTQRDLRVQSEWVVPLALGETVTMQGLAGVFDALSLREDMIFLGARGNDEEGDADENGNGREENENGNNGLDGEEGTTSKSASGKAGAASKAGPTTGRSRQEYPNPKRVLLAMKARDGLGGDGTVAYYVCLEGEVKPRQNG